jgi:hypothetical protein
MMIAKSSMNIAAYVAGRQHRSPLSISVSSLPENSGVLMPSRRDREVPYGMKGGEQNGCKKGR